MLLRKYEFKQDLLPRSIVMFSVIAMKMSVSLFHQPILNCISSFMMCLVIIFIFYRCSLKTALIYSFLFLMIALVGDVVGVLIVSSFFGHTITETLGASELVWHQYIWNWLLQIFLSRISAVIIRKNDNIEVKWHEMAFYIFLFSFEVIVFASVSAAVQDFMSGQFLIFIMLGFMLLDIYIMYIFHRVSLSRKNEQKVRLMQQQEQLQLQMYSELRKRYNATCQTAHDINRHISSLRTLIAAFPNHQAEDYFADLTRDVERLRPVIRNQNAMLEIILNTVSDRCEKENIVLEMNAEDFPLDFISDIDVTAIFSNLFDNAIDECMELSKSRRKINFALKKQMGLIVLRISNPCRDKGERNILSNGSSKPQHYGIGLSNVRNAVERYNGILLVRKDEEQFCVSITFNDNM